MCIEAAKSRDFERGIASQFPSLIGFGRFDDGDHRASGWGFLGFIYHQDTSVNYLSSYLACSNFQFLI